MNEQIQISKQVKQLGSIRTAVNNLEQEYPYAWFVGLDFKIKHDPVVPEIAVKRSLGWLTHLARVHDAHFAPFISVEPMYTGKRMSVHMILRCDRPLTKTQLRQAWKLGHSYVAEYDPLMRGVEYMFDHHIGQSTHVVCSGKKPCRRNRKGRVFCTKQSQQVLSLQ